MAQVSFASPSAHSTTAEPGFIQIRNLVKRFVKDQVAVDNVSIAVPEGKILTLLGPSGCGKTTTMRCVAGLETPDSGSITIGGEVVTSVEKGVMMPPECRNVGMVFQSYAIWPHMTVFDNVAFPLQVRRLKKEEVRKRVLETLELVGLEGMDRRNATQLSGGQQQRVALARVLVFHPTVLLFDEPLSNLDARLRERMRLEIRRIQKEVGITSVYVTHDQSEAAVVSDLVAVMNKGRVEQTGSARSLYERPADRFVAEFLGAANLLPAEVVSAGDSDAYGKVHVEDIDDPATLFASMPEGLSGGDRILVMVRPEHVNLFPQLPDVLPGACVLSGTLKEVIYSGNHLEYIVGVAGHALRVHSFSEVVTVPGERVWLTVEPQHVACLPME